MLGSAMPRDLDGSIQPLLVVVNPTAGRGRARRRGRQLAAALQRAGVPFAMVATAGPGDAERLASAPSGGPAGALVAVGGDGTVHEVLNGLVQRADQATRGGPLAVLPSGSGDDFAANAGFGQDVDELVRRLQRGERRAVDLGTATLQTAAGARTRAFANNLGIGFEADVVRAAAGMWLRGRALYLAATVRALLRQRPFAATITLDGREAPPQALLFASFCNGARVGGGLPFCPAARLDDGRFGLLQVAATTRRGTLALLHKLVHDRHRGDPRVRTLAAATAFVRSERPIPVAMDGELVDSAVTELRVTMVPGALVLCGASLPTPP